MILLSAGIGLSAGPRSALAGLSTDILFWLRDHSFGPRHPDGSSQVAVVLVDEATYAAPDFRDLPKEAWTPAIGSVLSAINAASPRAIGFDIILPTTIGMLQAGFDTPFLRALHSAESHLVLSKFQGSGAPLLPFRGYSLAAGGDSHVRSINLAEDADGVVRSEPMQLRAQSGAAPEPGFAFDLASRAATTKLAPPGDQPMRLNFDGGYPFAAYSFLDLYNCRTDAAFFTSHFHDKVVLIGTALDVEDRQLTSRRFINPPERMTGDRCTPGAAPPASPFVRATLPGVFIHATAIDNLLRGEVLQPLTFLGRLGWVLLPTALAAGLAVGLPIAAGAVGMPVLLVLVAAASTAVFAHARLPPMLEAMLAAVLAFAILLGFRFLLADRDKRLIRQIFGLYLAPAVAEPLIAAGRLPELGGERREISLLFSDVAGFTTLTEANDPSALGPVLNQYFDGISEAVFAHGGLIVEFLGDGVYAIFGAPLVQSDHAARAISCARAIDEFTEHFRHDGEAARIGFGHTRIGVHTGEVMIGNFGGTRRFKYAALGDVVNTTSRLEGLNKYIGTRVCVSDAAVRASGGEDTRPIGRFVVKGRAQPMLVHEALASGDGSSAFMREFQAAYALLGQEDARAAFERLAAERPEDGVVRFYRERFAVGEITSLVVMADK